MDAGHSFEDLLRLSGLREERQGGSAPPAAAAQTTQPAPDIDTSLGPLSWQRAWNQLCELHQVAEAMGVQRSEPWVLHEVLDGHWNAQLEPCGLRVLPQASLVLSGTQVALAWHDQRMPARAVHSRLQLEILLLTAATPTEVLGGRARHERRSRESPAILRLPDTLPLLRRDTARRQEVRALLGSRRSRAWPRPAALWPIGLGLAAAGVQDLNHAALGAAPDTALGTLITPSVLTFTAGLLLGAGVSAAAWYASSEVRRQRELRLRRTERRDLCSRGWYQAQLTRALRR